MEIDKLDKVKSKNLVGIKYPDKLLDVNKITNNNYDFVIIDDNKLSYKYLDNNSKTIYEINEDITDDDVDVISSFDFPVLYIEFKENLNFDEVESFFKLSKITSKFNSNFFMKTNRILNTEQLQILFNLGIIGLILDSKITNKKNILNLNKNLESINTDKKKSSISPDLSSNLNSIFDSKEVQDSLKKSYKSVEVPWSINDVLKDSNLILNGCSLKKNIEFFEIIKNNNTNLPIIDLSLLKSKSIQDYDDNNLSNTVLHSMPVGKMNIDSKKENIRIPVILNNQLKTIKDDTIEFFFNLLKLKLRFIDIDEHDSLIVSNYVLTNLYLLHLLEDMENKSSILSSNFNMNYINEFSNIIDDEILDNFDDFVFSKITASDNFQKFIEKIKRNGFRLPNSKAKSFTEQDLLSIPKSKDTLLSLFFGEKFSKTISNWGKERK